MWLWSVVREYVGCLKRESEDVTAGVAHFRARTFGMCSRSTPWKEAHAALLEDFFFLRVHLSHCCFTLHAPHDESAAN